MIRNPCQRGESLKIRESILKSYIFPPLLDSHYSFKNTFDAFQICFHIFGGMKHLPEMDGLTLAIHHCHYDGDPRIFGDVIKALFPFCHLVARAFRRDHQDELLRFIANLHHLLYQTGGFFSVHRNSAAIAEEPANRKAEQLRLAHKVDVCTQAEDHAQKKEEVPVGGVRRADQDELGEVGQLSVYTPASQAHHGSGKIVIESAENRCIKNRSVHFRLWITMKSDLCLARWICG